MDNVLYQHTVLPDSDDHDGDTILYVTEEVNFVIISLDDPDLGVVPIAVDSKERKNQMVATGVQLSTLPPKDIIELASALQVVHNEQQDQVELKNGSGRKH